MPESISKSRAERETRDGKECLYAAYGDRRKPLAVSRQVRCSQQTAWYKALSDQAQHILSTRNVKANGVRWPNAPRRRRMLTAPKELFTTDRGLRHMRMSATGRPGGP